MGSTADKASGLANEAIGKIKQGVGSAVGSDKLKAEGAAQELKGDVQKAVGDAKAAVKDGANKAAAAANRKSLTRRHAGSSAEPAVFFAPPLFFECGAGPTPSGRSIRSRVGSAAGGANSGRTHPARR